TNGRLTGAPVGVEFVSGAITSSGIADSFGGQSSLTDQVKLINPHIAYADTARRGYAVAEATETELKVSFRAPGTVKQPVSPVSTIASFTVPLGDNTVHVG